MISQWYNHSMKKILLFLLVLFFFPASAYAHVGGGPPFLEINGSYSPTNPFFSNDPNLNIPQDINTYPKPLIIGQPITFTIDTDKLLVPPDIAASTTYRWTFGEKDHGTDFGKEVKHTYYHPGSYLLILEAKAPGENEYITIDTIQLDILPTKTYKVPSIKLSLQTNHRDIHKPIHFLASVTTDKTAKIIEQTWVFGDQTKADTLDVFHTYQFINNFSTYPALLRVIDSHGFIRDAGVIVQIKEDKFHFIDANGQENTIPVSDSQTTPEKKTDKPIKEVFGFYGILLIVFLVIFFIIKRYVHRKTKGSAQLS